MSSFIDFTNMCGSENFPESKAVINVDVDEDSIITNGSSSANESNDMENGTSF